MRAAEMSHVIDKPTHARRLPDHVEAVTAFREKRPAMFNRE